jgi:DNA-binding response OmpR family regulator
MAILCALHELPRPYADGRRVLFSSDRNALAEDVTTFKNAGAQHVLLKPINRSELTAALRMYLPRELTSNLPI